MCRVKTRKQQTHVKRVAGSPRLSRPETQPECCCRAGGGLSTGFDRDTGHCECPSSERVPPSPSPNCCSANGLGRARRCPSPPLLAPEVVATKAVSSTGVSQFKKRGRALEALTKLRFPKRKTKGLGRDNGRVPFYFLFNTLKCPPVSSTGVPRGVQLPSAANES